MWEKFQQAANEQINGATWFNTVQSRIFGVQGKLSKQLQAKTPSPNWRSWDALPFEKQAFKRNRIVSDWTLLVRSYIYANDVEFWWRESSKKREIKILKQRTSPDGFENDKLATMWNGNEEWVAGGGCKKEMQNLSKKFCLFTRGSRRKKSKAFKPTLKQ